MDLHHSVSYTDRELQIRLSRMMQCRLDPNSNESNLGFKGRRVKRRIVIGNPFLLSSFFFSIFFY